MNSTLKSRSCVVLFVTSGIVCSAALLAGPLTPPAGPVAPTFKTLAEVEPRIAINAANTPGDSDSLYKITQPGSYYLTGNVAGVADKHGIEIAAGGVTIDLGGFEVVGVPGMGAFDGVSGTVNDLASITVRNGNIRGWGGQGIDLWGIGARNCTVADVHVIWCEDDGIRVGIESTVTGCKVVGNGVTGIAVDVNSRIAGCTSNGHSSYGLYINGRTAITDCVVSANGLWGIFTGDLCSIEHCTVTENANGIRLGSGGRVSECSVTRSTGGMYMIRAAGNTLISDVAIKGGGYAVWLDNGGNRVQGCKIGNATTAIYSDAGIDTIVDNTLNSAAMGAGRGIELPAPDCVVDGNTFYGFNIGIDANYMHQRSTIIRNRFARCTYPVAGGGPMTATVSATAAAATHPLANTAY